MWQAQHTSRLLKEQGVPTEILTIKTQGDRIQHLSFDKMEGKGFFTKEIEEALLQGEVDLAVHSMKDLSTDQPRGLVIGGVSEREDPADALVMPLDNKESGRRWGLPENPLIGTSSARRKALLRHLLGSVRLQDIRGNVPTRLGKMVSQQLDGILLAMAGLKRLQIDQSAYRVIRLNPREFVPAPAQGVLAWQVRESDKELRSALLRIHRKDVASCTNVERKILKLMDGGCHLPLGAYCERDRDGYYHVWAALGDPGGDSSLRTVQYSSSTSFELAEQIVESLRSTVS